MNFFVTGLTGAPGSDATGFERGVPLYPPVKPGESSSGGGFGGNPIPAGKSIEQSIVVQLEPGIETIRVASVNWFYSTANASDRMGALQVDIGVTDIPLVGQ